MVIKLFKMLFGDVPAQWVRLIVLGVAVTVLYYMVKEFKQDMMDQGTAVQLELRTYIQSNQVWQEASKEERARLLRKANARFKRLYSHNGWEYEDLEP